MRHDMPNGSVVVVGSGVIGLAVACHLVQDGVEVTLVDRDPEGDRASHGNAGGIAVSEVVPASVPGMLWRIPGWLLDPLGPLAVRPSHAPKLARWLWRFSCAGTTSEVARISAALATLLGRVYDDLVPMLAATGLNDQLHRRGALTVYETEAGFRRDANEWALKRSHGIEAIEMAFEEARRLEPALGPMVCRAVFTPQWSHISDPKRLVDGLRSWLQANGLSIIRGEVVEITPSDDGGAGETDVRLADGRSLRGHTIVVATGAWSGRIARRLGDKVLIESERGYNATLVHPGVSLEREIIFAERKFVATPLSCGLRIGGAAEFGGLDAIADYRRSEALVTLARRYLPGLRTGGGENWAGHRPATPDSLPVIGRSGRYSNVVYAFGHGHLGLTLAATTGRLVADLVSRRPPTIELGPYAATRFG